MTQYISSFLLDSVVRQARRLSGVAVDGENVQTSAAAASSDLNPRLRHLDTTAESRPHGGTIDEDAMNESAEEVILDDRLVTESPTPIPNTSGTQLSSVAPSEQLSEQHTLSSTEASRGEALRGAGSVTRPALLQRTPGSYPTSTNEARLISRELSIPVYQRVSGINMDGVSLETLESEGDRALPEDDGMHLMRRKILEIQKLNLPMPETSRLIHALMTEHYTSSQAESRSLAGDNNSASYDHDTQHSQADPVMLRSTSLATGSSSDYPSNLPSLIHSTDADRKPTYWVAPTPANPEHGAMSSRRASLDSQDPPHEPILGCPHYKRNVKLQCSTCARWYTCRFCHDEVEDHNLIRRDTKCMLCMLCGCAQPAGAVCRDCRESTARYYCDVCKLWDNDPAKSIYHCDDCGICRLGQGIGKDFFHCKTCRACLSISIRDTHRCIERSTDSDCPICGEYMFTSPKTVVFMRCGHCIHQICYRKHTQTSFKCPLCSRSLINMDLSFRNLDRAIEEQPMPPEFDDTQALVYCNDCYAKTSVKYHWLGLKCANCDSYNTARLQILSAGITANAAAPTSASTNQAIPQPSGSATAISANFQRGRTTSIWMEPRFAMSTSALNLQSSADETLGHPRHARSTSASMRYQQTPLGSRGPNASTSVENMDAMSDDEADFWGASGLGGNHEERVESGSSDGDDDDETTHLEIESESESEDDDDDDDFMVITGHR